MRVSMALQALAVKSAHHCIVMRIFVAIAAIRYRRMFGLVAEGTGEFSMLCFAI